VRSDLSFWWPRHGLSSGERRLLVAFGCWIGLAVLRSALNVEFTPRRVESALVFAFWATPFFFLLLAKQVRPGRRRSVYVLTGALTFVAIFPAMWALDPLLSTEQFDPSCEPQLRRAFGRDELVLYRANCGAPCTDGLVLQQEHPLLGGVGVAEVLGSWYPADTATLSILPNGMIQVVVGPYLGRRSVPMVEIVRGHHWSLLP